MKWNRFAKEVLIPFTQGRTQHSPPVLPRGPVDPVQIGQTSFADTPAESVPELLTPIDRARATGDVCDESQCSHDHQSHENVDDKGFQPSDLLTSFSAAEAQEPPPEALPVALLAVLACPIASNAHMDTGSAPTNDTRLVSVNRADRDTIGHSNVAPPLLAPANLQTPNLLCVDHRMAIGTLLLRTKGAGLVILQFDPGGRC